MLKDIITFRTGGPVKCVYEPSTIDEIKQVLQYCRLNNNKYFVLGNGSNVLFTDEGYDGIIIRIYNHFNDINVDNDLIYAQSGAMLSKIAVIARDNSLTGMEFASGIPGTLGGAVVMNAGAYGGEMKDIIEYVDLLYTDGNVKRVSCADMGFVYRKSIVDENIIVLGAGIRLDKGNKSDIEARMKELMVKRNEKQPVELPSAGSTFKRPEGYFAAKLIEDAGLKGYKHGGAMVSDKHSGFVVNYNNATSSDIIELMEHIKTVVMEKFGVMLEAEVRIIR